MLSLFVSLLFSCRTAVINRFMNKMHNSSVVARIPMLARSAVELTYPSIKDRAGLHTVRYEVKLSTRMSQNHMTKQY